MSAPGIGDEIESAGQRYGVADVRVVRVEHADGTAAHESVDVNVPPWGWQPWSWLAAMGWRVVGSKGGAS